ncbi:MAG: hypothetical protein IKI81_04620 [Selenomonadaceae bacterium]|nr:hypothetical protein [Selenomonadaceae bacterium]
MAELTGKTINELPNITHLTNADLFPVSVNGQAGKLTFENLKDNIPIVGYVDDASARADFTLTSGGYYRITPPSGFPSGAKTISVAALAWTSSNGINIIPYGSAATEAYVIGPASASVTGLKTRWWYVI